MLRLHTKEALMQTELGKQVEKINSLTKFLDSFCFLNRLKVIIFELLEK